MANTFKSGSNPSGITNSLFRNDFTIGIGAVGPTIENTGYYNGITPSSGGYTIYQLKPFQGPSIRVASDDSWLITIAKQYGADNNITTKAEALSYFNSQNDIVVANFDYENIVTDSLLVNVDAGFIPSFPTTGSVWYDLSGNTYNGALINEPTFNSSNSGSLIFNGINNYVNINSGASILSNVNYTKIAWFYVTNFATNNNIISGGNTGQHAFWLFGSNKLNAGHNGNWDTVVSTTTLSLNTWYCGAVTFSTTSGWKLYLNGVQEATSASTTTFTGTGDIQIAQYQTGNNFTGRIAIAQVYNKVLSATEIQQNYNAQKGRFGL